ncbi:MAG: FAD-dependent oxidoreductase [Phycisphaerales bacterium]|nr:FAD-dependent oxidoreductase [Phycisphaerales bacterium]
MFTRRVFLRGGLAAIALGLSQRGKACGPPRPRTSPLDTTIPHPGCLDTGALPGDASAPLVAIPDAPRSVVIDGLPFEPWFTGDDFVEALDVPFHMHTVGEPQRPQEQARVVVIGGGLSGLASAYLLREHQPITLEMYRRFGGVSRGEAWRDLPYSLGGAYFITPDRGTFLSHFYRRLGLHRVRREAPPGDLFESHGAILDDWWECNACTDDERAAFERYAAAVRHFADEKYPDIPLPEEDFDWIMELDQRTLWEDIEQRIGMPLPRRLAEPIQAYCYSSFNAGAQDISAAAGWNFIAAEEYGRWVLPGGNAYMTNELWRRLGRLDRDIRPECRPHHLRSGCIVTDVRLDAGGVLVTYMDQRRNMHTIAAERVIVAAPKFVAKRFIHNLEALDAEKWNAIHQVFTYGYLVVNVLLNQPVERDFYEIWMLGDSDFPLGSPETDEQRPVTDLVNGSFATRETGGRHVLTFYYPLPFATSRFTLLIGEPHADYAARIAPHVRRLLARLGIPDSAVQQVRMSRWGHAMPLASPRVLADGLAEKLRRPIADRIFFVNQDNWALPAVETCLLEAETMTGRVEELL